MDAPGAGSTARRLPSRDRPFRSAACRPSRAKVPRLRRRHRRSSADTHVAKSTRQVRRVRRTRGQSQSVSAVHSVSVGRSCRRLQSPCVLPNGRRRDEGVLKSRCWPGCLARAFLGVEGLFRTVLSHQTTPRDACTVPHDSPPHPVSSSRPSSPRRSLRAR